MVVSDHAPMGERSLDVAWFRHELEQEREFRLEQLISLSYDVEVPCSAPLAEVRATLTAGARRALAEIDAALFRLARGTFGGCERCGRRIPAHRLAAIPTTRLCLRCERSQTHHDT
ncbi:TraR/DksA family transcriptional regulator [Kribbella sp. NPDC051586]|uniref:TraR/DksA family transcriptional regulator n=1 Tax=Kribbella sp. NPDC051586 TaxID=3364118 RepID=UPI00378F1732